jgi:hypothetical protein
MQPHLAPAYDVLGAVLNESTWALREEWGATYGIGASVARNADGSAHVMLGGAIENAQLGRSVVRLLGILGALGAGTIAEPMFLTKRWDVGREFMNRYATASAQGDAIMTARLRGWPLTTWDQYPDNLANTTRQTLKDLLGPCVGKEAVTIVGDASVLRPQLDQQGLALQ